MKLGYIFSRYPLPSETFIVREMEEIAALGHELDVAPLLAAPPLTTHATAGMQAAIAVPPWLPEGGPAALAASWRAAPTSHIQTWAVALWTHKGHWNSLAGAALFWPKAIAIARRFERAGVEHIHAHYATHPALVAWMVHRLTGIPFSFTAHAHDIFVHRSGLALKVAAAAFVATVSEFNRQLLARCFPDWQRKIAVVHCGVRPELYERPRTPAADGRLRLLCVASLQPYKGHRTLLEACDRLRGRLDFTCRLIGWGPQHGALIRETRRRGLATMVTFGGPAGEQHIARELADADVFVLPSVVERSGKMDGLPVALMEAMAAGLPVVASDLSGIPELVRHEQTGLLTPPGDAKTLAEAIFMLRDPALRAQLAQRGRELVRREFDAHRSALELTSLFAGASQPAHRVGEVMPAPAAPLPNT